MEYIVSVRRTATSWKWGNKSELLAKVDLVIRNTLLMHSVVSISVTKLGESDDK